MKASEIFLKYVELESTEFSPGSTGLEVGSFRRGGDETKIMRELAKAIRNLE